MLLTPPCSLRRMSQSRERCSLDSMTFPSSHIPELEVTRVCPAIISDWTLFPGYQVPDGFMMAPESVGTMKLILSFFLSKERDPILLYASVCVIPDDEDIDPLQNTCSNTDEEGHLIYQREALMISAERATSVIVPTTPMIASEKRDGESVSSP